MALVPMKQATGTSAVMPSGQSLQILIRQGKVDEQTPEFVQFKRQNITRWGALTHLIQ